VKTFDPASHAANDKRAKEAGLRWLKSIGVEAHEYEDVHGWDLVERDSYLEVEVKNIWKTGRWPIVWQEVNVLDRKGVHMAENVHLLLLRDDLGAGLLVTGKAILESPRGLVKNRLVPQGEWMFKVPLHLCREVDVPAPTAVLS